MKLFGKKKTEKKYTVGLALSGGGARGFSHLGSAKALMEKGYQPDVIIGTSMGAIVGCLLADGYLPDEIMSMLTPDLMKSFIKTDLGKNGLMSMKGGRDILKNVLRAKNIEELKIPFIATATDLDRGEAHYFTKGNIIDAVMASSSIPIIFPPVVIDKVQYVDGGVLNNLPARFIREDCEKLFGFDVNPHTLGLRHEKVSGLVQIAERTFHLGILGNVLPDRDVCDYYIEHCGLNGYRLFDFSKLPEIFEIGYRGTLKALEEEKTE